jgi:hypothetical protein
MYIVNVYAKLQLSIIECCLRFFETECIRSTKYRIENLVQVSMHIMIYINYLRNREINAVFVCMRPLDTDSYSCFVNVRHHEWNLVKSWNMVSVSERLNACYRVGGDALHVRWSYGSCKLWSGRCIAMLYNGHKHIVSV